jgi:hypothetical protein
MKSIIQNKKECYVCRMLYDQEKLTTLHNHHIIFGNNKPNSEKYGLKVWVCYNHHEGTDGVHGKNGHSLDMQLKKIAQRSFMRHYNKTKIDFKNIFYTNYL